MRIIFLPLMQRKLKIFKTKHYPMERFYEALSIIINHNVGQLKALHAHKLSTGEFELHLSSDWLLVYKFENRPSIKDPSILERCLILCKLSTHDTL